VLAFETFLENYPHLFNLMEKRLHEQLAAVGSSKNQVDGVGRDLTNTNKASAVFNYLCNRLVVRSISLVAFSLEL